jgi:hypothetical protein
MKFRKAKEADVPIILEMIADDELGKTRENLKMPLLYYNAFVKINSDENQELLIVENEKLKNYWCHAIIIHSILDLSRRSKSSN